MDLLNLVLFLIGISLCYYLALAFVGISKSFKESLLPILVFSTIAYLSKVVLHATPTIHTLVLVSICTLMLYAFHKVNIILSLVGSLLTFMTVTFGSLLISFPLLLKLGITLPPSNTNGLAWICLNIADWLVLLLAIFTVKISRFSISKLTASM